MIVKDEQHCYNGGYLFLQKIYYELGLDYICKKIAKKHKQLKYDLSGIVYYDLTNYFFEWEEEGGLVQFGHCKEGRPLPIVQMGLFMDYDGFPPAMCIEPGNTAETQHAQADGADTQGQIRPVKAGCLHGRRPVLIRKPQE